MDIIEAIIGIGETNSMPIVTTTERYFSSVQPSSSFITSDLTFQVFGADGAWCNLYERDGETQVRIIGAQSGRIYRLEPDLFYQFGRIRVVSSLSQDIGATLYFKERII